ncbi:MAG: GTPase HflX, partial [Quisquiliibacterium sp.]
SAPDRDEQAEQVKRVLAEIGADKVPVVTVLNKIDAVGLAAEARPGPCGSIQQVLLSAQTGAGVDLLRRVHAERSCASKELRHPGAGGAEEPFGGSADTDFEQFDSGPNSDESSRAPFATHDQYV